MSGKKRTYYLATFTALIEADSESDAASTATEAAESIDEHIGSRASGDPWMYRTKSQGVVLYEGPDPFPDHDGEEEDEEYDVGRVRGVAAEAARIARLEPQRSIIEIVGQVVDNKPPPPTHCGHGVPFDEEPQCQQCAIETRAYLSGLVKRPVL